MTNIIKCSGSGILNKVESKYLIWSNAMADGHLSYIGTGSGIIKKKYENN